MCAEMCAEADGAVREETTPVAAETFAGTWSALPGRWASNGVAGAYA